MQPGASADPFPFAGLLPRTASMLPAGGDAFRQRLASLQEPVAQMPLPQGDPDRQATDTEPEETAAADPGDSGIQALASLAVIPDPIGGTGGKGLVALDDSAAPLTASPIPESAAPVTATGPAGRHGRVTEALLQGRFAVARDHGMAFAVPHPAPPEAASASATGIAPQVPESPEEIAVLPRPALAGAELPRPGQPPGLPKPGVDADGATHFPAQGIKVADQSHATALPATRGLAAPSAAVSPPSETGAPETPVPTPAPESSAAPRGPVQLIASSGTGQNPPQNPPLTAARPAAPGAASMVPAAELSPLEAVPRIASAEPLAAPTLSAGQNAAHQIPVTVAQITADSRRHPETSHQLAAAGRSSASQAESLGKGAPPDGRSAAPTLYAEAGPGLASGAALPRLPAAATAVITPRAILPDGSTPVTMAAAPAVLDPHKRQASAPLSEVMPLPRGPDPLLGAAPAAVPKASAPLPLPLAAPLETPQTKSPPGLARSDGTAADLPAPAYAPAPRAPVSAAPPPAALITLKRREAAGGDPAVPAPLPLRAEPGPVSDLPARSTPLPPAETAHRIAAQIAQRVPEPGGSGFDLKLSPDELGQVRLRLVSVESGSLLVIYAERPDTLELMRRHIGLLENDLRALGHEQLSLRFAGGGQDQNGGQSPGASNSPPAPHEGATPRQAAPEPTPGPTQAAAALPARRDTIDLRL